MRKWRYKSCIRYPTSGRRFVCMWVLVQCSEQSYWLCRQVTWWMRMPVTVGVYFDRSRRWWNTHTHVWRSDNDAVVLDRPPQYKTNTGWEKITPTHGGEWLDDTLLFIAEYVEHYSFTSFRYFQKDSVWKKSVLFGSISCNKQRRIHAARCSRETII